jgi:hypothetical protein
MPVVDPIPPRSFFDGVVFIIDGVAVDVPADTKYLCNKDGLSVYSATPQGKQIPVTPEDPSLSLGRQYRGITFTEKEMGAGTEGAYKLAEFDFKSAPDPVVYQPLWAHADPRNTQAFGFTLVRNGECVPFSYDGMIDSPYTYGVYAGFQSPYIGSDRSRELLKVNASDLEHHAFPHVFCSIDTVPLVTSVARWRPSRQEIWLADLWVEPGDLLFLPPKVYSDEYTDMHGNRNSAFACWDVDGKSSLLTRTTLGDEAVFTAEATKPHYHEEKTHTIHTRPD